MIHPTSTVAPYKFTSKSEVFPTWASLPTSKEIRGSLPKVRILKFILQIAASNCVFQTSSIFKSYVVSPISALLWPTCSTSSFQKTCWKSQNLYKRSSTHFQKMSLALCFWAIFVFNKKVFCLVNWAKAKALSSTGKIKTVKIFSNLSNSRFRSLIAWILLPTVSQKKRVVLFHFTKQNTFF